MLLHTVCPFTWAALRALSLCQCPEAANPAAVPPLPGLPWLAAKHQQHHEADIRQAILNQLIWQPDDHVLAIGFGAGDALGTLLARAPQGHVAGVERSLERVTQAARRHQFSIKTGRLELEQAEPEALPYEYARFNKVLVATDYAHWPNPEQCLTELQRVLQPGGQIALGLPLKTRARWQRTDKRFNWDEAQEVAGLVRWVGFEQVKLVSTSGANGWACVTARR